MTPLDLSEAADTDLDNILSYSIIQFGEAVASEYFFSFEESFDMLRRHPLAGASADDAGPDVRSLHHRSHRIYYEVTASRILVLRILHQSMDARNRFALR